MIRSRNLTGFFRIALIALAVGVAAGPLGGCAGAAVGAGATVGVAAMEERPIEIIAQDTAISARIKLSLVEAGEEYAARIGIEVYEGRVLVTGAVPNEEMRAEAVRLAWKVRGVRDVLNEVQVRDSGLRDFAQDSWVTAQLTSKMTFDKQVLAINYSIETVHGTIYLIGLAQSRAELDRVIAHARSINYVRNVISHVRVKEGV